MYIHIHTAQLCGPQMMGVVTSASALRPLNRPILPSAPLRSTHCCRFGRKRQFEGQHMAGYVKLHPVRMQAVFAGMRPHFATNQPTVFTNIPNIHTEQMRAAGEQLASGSGGTKGWSGKQKTWKAQQKYAATPEDEDDLVARRQAKASNRSSPVRFWAQRNKKTECGMK